MAVYLKLDFESHPLKQTVLSLCSVCVCWLQRAQSYISNVDCTQNMLFLRTRAHSASYCWWWSEPFTSIPLTLSSLLLLHKSLHFPISTIFPWPETEDVRWQRCQHRSQWSSPAVLFPLAQELMHSSPFSVLTNLMLLFSGSTFLPIKSSHCLALQGLVTLDYSGRKACVNVSLSNPSSFLPLIQIRLCVSVGFSFSFPLPAYLFSFSGLACEFLLSALLLNLHTFQAMVSPPRVVDRSSAIGA